eukprot:2341769-Rhodomonas_salina.2
MGLCACYAKSGTEVWYGGIPERWRRLGRRCGRRRRREGMRMSEGRSGTGWMRGARLRSAGAGACSSLPGT